MGHDVDVESMKRHKRVFFEALIPNFVIIAVETMPTGWTIGYLDGYFTLSTGLHIEFYHRDYNEYEADTELIQALLNLISNDKQIEIVLYFEHLEKIVFTYARQRLVLNSLFDIWDEKRPSLSDHAL